jgi:phosphohistidine phosphatase SixA
MRAIHLLGRALAASLLVLGTVAAAADPAPLLRALRSGGCLIVMRHASSPREAPSPADAAPGNGSGERQLDAKGKETARAMGAALRKLNVPVTEVLSSPTFRAQETAMEAGLPKPSLVPELGDGGQSMAATGEAEARWLRQKVARPAGRGNLILITHFPNIRAAFPDQAADLADGEALVFVPDAGGGTRMLGRIRIEEWTSFADRP